MVYPPRCPTCRTLTAGTAACAGCESKLEKIDHPICGLCGKPVITKTRGCRDCRGVQLFYDTARAVWVYESVAKDLIQALKYKNERNLAPQMAAFLAPLVVDADLITWVPLARGKLWRRGYNQAKLLAKSVGSITGTRAEKTLTKPRPTRDQNQLGLDARRRNLRGAFALPRPEAVAGRRVVLVDDVYTTGSTVNECARTLRKARPADIRVVTLARTLLRR